MSSFIIAGTFNCNCACSHCGVGNVVSGNQILDIEVGISALRHCMEMSLRSVSGDSTFIAGSGKYGEFSGEEVEIIFHGGEPLLPGPFYYEKFLATLFRSFPDKKFSFYFQTNLTLYDSRWRDFFKNYGVKVGTSFDFFTDFRKLKNGKDYWSIWLDKVKRFQDDFGEEVFVITVVSRLNKDRVVDIIQIARHVGLRLKFVPLRDAGRARNFYTDAGLTPEEYGRLLITAYDAGKVYDVYVENCKEVEDYVLGRSDLFRMKCPYSGNCTGSIWFINPDGDVYNCSTSFQHGRYYLGNYRDGIKVENFVAARTDDLSIPVECFNCNICGGGCKLFRDESGRFFWCKSYRMFYDYVRSEVKSQVNMERVTEVGEFMTGQKFP